MEMFAHAEVVVELSQHPPLPPLSLVSRLQQGHCLLCRSPLLRSLQSSHASFQRARSQQNGKLSVSTLPAMSRELAASVLWRLRLFRKAALYFVYDAIDLAVAASHQKPVWNRN